MTNLRNVRNAAHVLAAALALVAFGAAEARAACGAPSWVAGTVDLCAGEIVYRDYVLDDFGAADGPPITDPALVPLVQVIDQLTGDLSTAPQGDAYGFLPPDGAERYPAGEDNTADIVSFHLRVDASQVTVSVELNTLFAADTTQLAVAIDTDDDPLTGGGAWPGLTVRDGIAPLPDLPLTSSGWDEIHVFGVGDPVTNTITGSFPRPAGPSATWRIQAVTARADGRVMNVAFRGADETGFWWERHQAQALGSGDIGAFGHRVALADLDAGVTAEADPPPGAVRQRVYTSAHNPPPGEGLDHDGVPGPGFSSSNGGSAYSQAFNFLGRYQPYGFYEPDQPGPHGVQLMLHGLAENHSARLFFPGPNSGKIADHVGEARNRLLIAPLGRGWKSWWSNYAERDALDALADVVASYPVDPDQWHLSGYSMGGYGTYRIGSLNPDLWASAIVWVGAAGEFLAGVPFFEDFSGTGAEGDVLELIGNFRHIPTAMIYSDADELVPVPTALEVRDLFATLGTGLGGDAGYESVHWLHHPAEHLTYVLLDDWTKESDYTAGRALVRDPARVTFRTAPQSWAPALGIVQDHAYWISQIAPADASQFADVEARSHGCGDPDPLHTVVQDAGFGPPPLAFDSQEVLVADEAVDANQCLELELANVASLSVDLAATCLGPATPSWRIATDGPTTVALGNGDTIALPGAGQFSGGPALAIAPPAALVRVGRTAQFTADLRCVEDGAVVWSVQEPDGGTIDANGLYTAPAQITADGLAHVVATSVADGSIQAVAEVTLRQNAGRR